MWRRALLVNPPCLPPAVTHPLPSYLQPAFPIPSISPTGRPARAARSTPPGRLSPGRLFPAHLLISNILFLALGGRGHHARVLVRARGRLAKRPFPLVLLLFCHSSLLCFRSRQTAGSALRPALLRRALRPVSPKGRAAMPFLPLCGGLHDPPAPQNLRP